MKRSTKETLLVLADAFEEDGNTRMGEFTRLLAEGGPLYEFAMRSMGGEWAIAMAQVNKLERESQGINDESTESLLELAYIAHEDTIDDGVVELDDHPRILKDPGGRGFWVSGWFRIPTEQRRYPQPVVRRRWAQLNHDEQNELLRGLTGFDRDSLRVIEQPNREFHITGRPAHSYAHTGMRLTWGTLEEAIRRLVNAGLIAE